MGKSGVGVSLAAIGALLATSGCGTEPSNSVANESYKAESTSPANDAGRSPFARNRSIVLVDDVLVEDNVPKEFFPILRDYVKTAEKCVSTGDEFCRRSQKIGEEIEKREICWERWDDPLDKDGFRIRKWHVCGSTSFSLVHGKEYSFFAIPPTIA